MVIRVFEPSALISVNSEDTYVSCTLDKSVWVLSRTATLKSTNTHRIDRFVRVNWTIVDDTEFRNSHLFPWFFFRLTFSDTTYTVMYVNGTRRKGFTIGFRSVNPENLIRAETLIFRISMYGSVFDISIAFQFFRVYVRVCRVFNGFDDGKITKIEQKKYRIILSDSIRAHVIPHFPVQNQRLSGDGKGADEESIPGIPRSYDNHSPGKLACMQIYSEKQFTCHLLLSILLCTYKCIRIDCNAARIEFSVKLNIGQNRFWK